MTIAIDSHQLENFAASNLTLRQYRYWLAQSMSPDAPVQRLCVGIQITAAQAEQLDRAWSLLADTADALGAVLRETRGIPSIEFTGTPAPVERDRIQVTTTLEDAVHRWVGQRVLFGDGDYLIKSACLEADTGEWVWVQISSHLVSDGLSSEYIADSVIRTTSDLADGRAPTLRARPSFAENMHHERQRDLQTDLDAIARQWESMLRGAREPFELFGVSVGLTDPDRRIVRVDLSADDTQDLISTLRDERYYLRSDEVTMANFFVAFLAVWIWRHSGRTRLSIGVPFHGRTAEERDLIGFKSEQLPLVVDVDPEQPFSTLVQQVHESAKQILRHRGQSVANPAHAPTYLAVSNYQIADLTAAGRTEETYKYLSLPNPESEPRIVSNEITLSTRVIGGLALRFYLRQEHLDQTSEAAIQEGLRSGVEAFVRNPELPTAELPFTGDVQQAFFADAERTTADTAVRDLLAPWLEESRSNSTKPALIIEGELLDHATLKKRVGATAAALDMPRQMPVIVWSDTSIAQSVTCLALMGSGRIYTPVTADTKPDQVRKIADRIGASTILHAPACDPPAGDSRFTALTLPDTGSPRLPAAPAGSDVAHIFHTSGSTGEPKAIAVQHEALCHSLTSWIAALELEPGERIGHFYAPHFDPWLTGLLPALWLVGTCIMRPHDPPPRPAELIELLEQEKITTLYTPTSYFHAFTQALESWPHNLPLVRWIVGGEALSAERAAKFLSRCRNQVALFNAYGPTETTIWSSVCRIDDPLQKGVPIGRPLPSTGFRVADERGRPVPRACIGELWITGPQLAQGYWKDLERTAQAFVQQDGRRWYRTGDMVRWRVDGNLDFCGRRDRQLQIRGYRVEPAEVEAALETLPTIDRAHVTGRSTTSSTGLIAYLVAGADQAIDTTTIKAALLARLPAYKVPQWFVPVEALPMTATGKIDESALPPPNTDAEEGLELPTLTLWDLRQVFERVLDVQPVGVDQSFFDLGGDSLLLMELLDTIEAHFGRALEPGVILEHPTIGSLAPILETNRARPASLDLVLNAGTTPPLFCIPGAGGIGVEFYPLALALPVEQTIIALRPPGTDGFTHPLRDAQELINHYADRLESLREEQPITLVGYSLGGVFAFETARELTRRGLPVQLVAVIDSLAATKDCRKELARTPDGLRQWAWQLRSRFREKQDHQKTLKRLRAALDAALAEKRILDAESLGEYNALTQIDMYEQMDAKPADLPLVYFQSEANRRTDVLEHWRGLCPGLTVRRIEGDHHSIMKAPRVEALAQALGELIRNAAT